MYAFIENVFNLEKDNYNIFKLKLYRIFYQISLVNKLSTKDKYLSNKFLLRCVSDYHSPYLWAVESTFV